MKTLHQEIKTEEQAQLHETAEKSRLLVPPRPLALLLFVVAIFGCAWALLVPAWQSPDEPSHFSWVQTLVENQRLPGEPDKPPVSSELQKSLEITNTWPTVVSASSHPEWSAAREHEWGRANKRLPRDDGGGRNVAESNPPLYYAWASAAYVAFSNADIFTRIDAMRLWSGLWLLVTTVAAWLLAGELFARNQLAQLITAATAGLWPMVSFLSVSVNPDGMLYALSTLTLWLGVCIARRGLNPLRAAGIGGVLGLALVTKAPAVMFVPGVVVLLLSSVWYTRQISFRRRALALVLGLVMLVTPAIGWTKILHSGDRPAFAQVTAVSEGTATTNFNVREFGSYLWQFYLPKPGFLTKINHHVPVISDLPLLNTWIGMGWGSYGWVTIWFPPWTYIIFAFITTTIVALFTVFAIRRWRQLGGWRTPFRHYRVPCFLGLIGLATLAALHIQDYDLYLKYRLLFMQGRYLLPLIGIFAAAVAFVVLNLPQRIREVAAGIWIGGLIVLQLSALGLAAVDWYA